jgi:hypothetical protein
MDKFTTDGTGSVLDSEGCEVCYVHGVDDFRETAVLFSAAPKLLSALQNMVNRTCPYGHNFDCNCAYNDAKLAIKEALGEQ